MTSMTELVFEQVRSLPEADVREVLDFLGYLKSKHRTVEFAEGDEMADWGKFEKHACAWSGQYHRDECYDRKVLR